MVRYNPNKSFYHIVLEDYSGDNVRYEYYMTIGDVQKRLGVSRFTVNRALNDYNFETKLYEDIKLRRCYIPAETTITRKLSNEELDEMRAELLV